MKKSYRALVCVVAFICLFIAGCNSGKKSIVEFTSSDKTLNTFMNEYFERHVRNGGEKSNGEQPLGTGSLYAKEWEAMSLMWLDGEKLNTNAKEKMEYFIDNFHSDKFGYVWTSEYEFNPTTAGANDYPGHGWPFPNYPQGMGSQRGLGWEFNEAGLDNWTSNAKTMKAEGGLLKMQYEGEELILLSKDITVNSKFSPFIEIDFRIQDTQNYGKISDIDDVYFSWQTQGSDEWFTVSQKEWNEKPTVEIPSYFASRMYLPMYLNENWEGKIITKMKFSVKPKDQSNLNIFCNLNYFRMSFDSRQSNNNGIYISFFKRYMEFYNNKELLAKNINKARSAMQFMLSHLNGASGLLDISYLYGHDGIRAQGQGIGNGYWDILTAPSINLDANTYFYKAVADLAFLEKMAEDMNLKVEKPSVANATNTGTITYTETSESLNNLLPKIRNEVTKSLYDNEKGRFIWGIKSNGEKVDYGYTVFNLEAIKAGLASEEQEKSIMSWISGERIIDGETSTGEDIYKYEFAPRSSTVKNKFDYYWKWNGQNIAFGDQCQDGGAIMYVSYYDIASRLKSKGVDDAFNRLSGIKDWYFKVKQAGGEGLEFYRKYYNDKEESLQGGGSAGGLGLDFEFLESSLLYSVIPLEFFGFEGGYNELSFTPKLPSSLKNLGINGLNYNGVTFNVVLKANSFEIKNISTEINAKLKIRLSSNNIKVDGKKVETVKVGDYNEICIDFKNTKITF